MSFLGLGMILLPVLASPLHADASAAPAPATSTTAAASSAAAATAPTSAAPATGAPATGDAPGEPVSGEGPGAAAPAGPPPEPPSEVTAKDKPGDEGKHVTVRWKISPDDGAGTRSVIGYEVLRGPAAGGPFTATGTKAPAGKTEAVDEVPADGTDYWYAVRAITITGATSDSPAFGPARSTAQWFNPEKTSVAVFTLIFCTAAAIILAMARGGTHFYIRPIGGINAIDEAIGRATEMGKPILFVPGLQEADNVPTLAAFSILSRVAKKAAEYQTRLIVPCYYSMVMIVAREVVKGAYLEAGRPDAFQEKDVFYVTQEQFAYVAAINGIMLREKPATNFYLGAFFAESLMLAETGFMAGSIQIAGTDQPIQIPFFVAACDYTMIGEELYAAAAYLSDDPKQKATLKAQDLGKAVVLALTGAGAMLWAFLPTWAVWFSKMVADGEFLWSRVAGLFGMGS